MPGGIGHQCRRRFGISRPASSSRTIDASQHRACGGTLGQRQRIRVKFYSLPAVRTGETPEISRYDQIANSSLLFSFYNRHGHFDSVVRQIVIVPRQVDDLVRNAQSLRHFAEHGVFSIQEKGVFHDNEELRAGRIRLVGPRHRNDSALVRRITELRLQQNWIAFIIFWTALPERLFSERVFGIRITALNHEARNHAMKDGPIVKAGLRQLDKIVDVFGCEIGIKSHFHVAKLRLDDGFRTRVRRRWDNLYVALSPATREQTCRNQHHYGDEPTRTDRVTCSSWHV